ncbi:MAG: anaerobic ribonucleoside-triphosphate reductase activating protein [Erysipelotrichaceae bacterium]|nr:anaerobic ribonucleoside-triphosphate reductase activating protein [Erysipelotrichaceae bacterium]
MNIQGLLKTTLLDYPGKVACTLFCAGCNFHCPYCHNSSLISFDSVSNYTEEEVLAYLKKRQGILDGVCISGGECLLQEGLVEFIRKVKELGYLVKIDTNGYAWAKLKQLIDEGLVDYVAMDIKNCKDKYGITSGRIGSIEAIERCVELLMHSTIPYEFRTTVVKGYHTVEDMEEIGRWLQGADAYFIQNFKESEGVLTPRLEGFEKDELERFAEIVRRYIKRVEIRGL